MPARVKKYTSYLAVYRGRYTSIFMKAVRVITQGHGLRLKKIIAKIIIFFRLTGIISRLVDVIYLLSERLYLLFVPVWFISKSILKKKIKWIFKSYLNKKFFFFFSSPIFGVSYLFRIVKLSWFFFKLLVVKTKKILQQQSFLFFYYLIFKFEQLPAASIKKNIIRFIFFFE